MASILFVFMFYHLLSSSITIVLSNYNHLDQCAEPDICGLMAVDLSVDRQQFAIQALNVTDVSATDETKNIYR
jgi:hypothetical protein